MGGSRNGSCSAIDTAPSKIADSPVPTAIRWGLCGGSGPEEGAVTTPVCHGLRAPMFAPGWLPAFGGAKHAQPQDGFHDG